VRNRTPARGSGRANDRSLRIEEFTFEWVLNAGEFIVEPDDMYGAGVNIAARLEQLAAARRQS